MSRPQCLHPPLAAIETLLLLAWSFFRQRLSVRVSVLEMWTFSTRFLLWSSVRSVCHFVSISIVFVSGAFFLFVIGSTRIHLVDLDCIITSFVAAPRRAPQAACVVYLSFFLFFCSTCLPPRSMSRPTSTVLSVCKYSVVVAHKGRGQYVPRIEPEDLLFRLLGSLPV